MRADLSPDLGSIPSPRNNYCSRFFCIFTEISCAHRSLPLSYKRSILFRTLFFFTMFLEKHSKSTNIEFFIFFLGFITCHSKMVPGFIQQVLWGWSCSSQKLLRRGMVDGELQWNEKGQGWQVVQKAEMPGSQVYAERKQAWLGNRDENRGGSEYTVYSWVQEEVGRRGRVTTAGSVGWELAFFPNDFIVTSIPSLFCQPHH